MKASGIQLLQEEYLLLLQKTVKEKDSLKI